MSAKVFLVVYMLCYVYSVLSQLPPDGDEEDGGGRMVNRSYCAVLINDTDSDYERCELCVGGEGRSKHTTPTQLYA